MEEDAGKLIHGENLGSSNASYVDYIGQVPPYRDSE